MANSSGLPTREEFISNHLTPTQACAICREEFDGELHNAVALPCLHIFGHNCLLQWISTAQPNAYRCPYCRKVLFQIQKPQFERHSASPPEGGRIRPLELRNPYWENLYSQDAEVIFTFVSRLWNEIYQLDSNLPSITSTNSSTTSTDTILTILRSKIAAAIIVTGNSAFQAFLPMLTGNTDRLDESFICQPLLRLARFMLVGNTSLPKYLTSYDAMMILLWELNLSFPSNLSDLTWNIVDQATNLDYDTQPSHLLILSYFTTLISQDIVHHPIVPWSSNVISQKLAVRRRVMEIGRYWEGHPSSELLRMIYIVWMELRRLQIGKNKMSLRALKADEDIVRGLWRMAGMRENRRR